MTNDARPSSIGEILDRAIATYVRRAFPLFVILAIVVIPIALIEAAVQPGLAHSLATFNEFLRVPPGDTAGRAHVMARMQQNASPGGWVVLAFALQFIFSPLAYTALIAFATNAAGGVAISIGAAYRIALTRWVPQLAVAVAYFAIALVAMLGAVIVALLAGAAVFALSLLSKVLAAIIGVVLGIAAVIALFVCASLGNVAWVMSGISIVAEDPNPVRAVGRGLRRTFDRAMLRRTIGAALAVLALDWFGTLAIFAFAAVISLLTHSDIISGVITAAAGVVINGVSIVFVMFYMRDIRLRREGADLLLAAGEGPLPA